MIYGPSMYVVQYNWLVYEVQILQMLNFLP